jgi:hypothetical protein
MALVDDEANGADAAFASGREPVPPNNPAMGTPRHCSSCASAWCPEGEDLDVLVAVELVERLDFDVPVPPRNPLSGLVFDVSTVHPEGRSNWWRFTCSAA